MLQRLLNRLNLQNFRGVPVSSGSQEEGVKITVEELASGEGENPQVTENESW